MRENLTKRAMGCLWAAFTVAYLVFFYVFQDASEIADTSLDGYLEVILLGVPTVVLLAGVMWLHESDVDRDLRPRIVGWTVGMALFFALAMHTALFIVETGFDPGEQWLILLLSTGFGASSGTVTGVLEIRSKERERERNRSRERARRTERRRNQLEYLNHYLRHEVLNEAQKISGFASLLAERTDLDDESADYLATVHDSGEEIATFVESIRSILHASEHDPELAPTDVVSVVESEVEAVGRHHAGVEIAVEGPDSAPVLAGALLNRVFRNLLENAIEHNEDGVAIDVRVVRGPEWVTVRVRDTGSGIPAEVREQVFDPPDSGDHGYGLFLTQNLVEVYGGRLDLGETGPEGTEFVVRLPAASTPEVPRARRGARRPA
jgi:signal transduction histidine kinase